MATVYDVPPKRLIEDVSEVLKKTDGIEPPQWAPFVKTGVHKEKAPIQKDWWYTRVSAVLRSVYMKGPIGTSQLRGKYGGKQNRGSKPSHAAKGSGSIIREVIHQLEKSGMLEKTPEGRIVSPKGRSLLDNTAYEILKEMASEDPERSKYL